MLNRLDYHLVKFRGTWGKPDRKACSGLDRSDVEGMFLFVGESRDKHCLKIRPHLIQVRMRQLFFFLPEHSESLESSSVKGGESRVLKYF